MVVLQALHILQLFGFSTTYLWFFSLSMLTWGDLSLFSPNLPRLTKSSLSSSACELGEGGPWSVSLGNGLKSLHSVWECPWWPRVIGDSGNGWWNTGGCRHIEEDPVSTSLQFSNKEGT